MIDSIANEVAGILLDIESVSFRLNPPFKYTSGRVGPVYTDCRLIISHPKERERIVGFMADSVSDIEFDVVAGEGGSIPHAAWLSDKLEKPMLYLRKEAKGHGKENLIEGVLDGGSKVLVVEDLVNTGGSNIRTVEKIRKSGGIVTDCVSIFTYDLDDAIEKFEEAEVKLHSLCDFETALKLAVERDYISLKEAELARDWQKNPKDWRQ